MTQQFAPEETTNQFPPMPPNPPAVPKAKRRWLVPVLVAVALLLGAGIGSAKPAPDPVTVEKIVTKEVPVTVEKTVEVPVTPEACGTFTDMSAKVNDLTSEVIGIMSDSLQAAGHLDAATIQANNVKLDAQTAKLKTITPEYQSSRDTCRASLK